MRSEKKEREIIWYDYCKEFIRYMNSTEKPPTDTYEALEAWDEKAILEKNAPWKLCLGPWLDEDFSIERAREIINPEIIVKVFDVYEELISDKIGIHVENYPDGYLYSVRWVSEFLSLFDELLEPEYIKNRKLSLKTKLYRDRLEHVHLYKSGGAYLY